MTQYGSANHRAKLNESMVRAIRRAWAQNNGKCPTCGHKVKRIRYRDLAEQYGVSPLTIAQIVRREKWKHVTVSHTKDAE